METTAARDNGVERAGCDKLRKGQVLLNDSISFRLNLEQQIETLQTGVGICPIECPAVGPTWHISIGRSHSDRKQCSQWHSY